MASVLLSVYTSLLVISLSFKALNYPSSMISDFHLQPGAAPHPSLHPDCLLRQPVDISELTRPHPASSSSPQTGSIHSPLSQGMAEIHPSSGVQVWTMTLSRWLSSSRPHMKC